MYRDSFTFFLHFILFFTSLHVSTSTGHPQVQYTQSFLEAVTPTTDTVLGYTAHIYIFLYYFFFIFKI
jgi:hypothetical protein